MPFFKIKYCYFIPLGVQIKTNEDQLSNEFENTAFNKTRGKSGANNYDDKVNKRLFKLAGQDVTLSTPQIASRVEEKRGGRNKFEIEKPVQIDSRKRNEKFEDSSRFRLENKHDFRRQFSNKRDFRSRRDRERDRERERDKNRNRFDAYLFLYVNM